MIAIYLDESGDLGWTFTAPYGKGGSSRTLTIACVICPRDKTQHLNRIVTGFYKARKRPLNNELKSYDLSSKEKEQFVQQIIKLHSNHPDIKLLSITVNKKRVKTKLRNDPNALYNYMVKNMLLNHLCNHKHIDFIPDSRCEKVNVGWNLEIYLKQMIAERSQLDDVLNETLNVKPFDSRVTKELQFIDFYAGLVWSKYEFKDERVDQYFDVANPSNQLMFFEYQ
ncbi:DUF3800 domain-containing protein [Acinetobacter baumannii]|uniref:DUF3800 domain-containing protein n=7 Tax=Acinetobacter baumannii TaxID=470 RepID=A0A3R9RRS4_ACIBA|nr:MULTISPECIES: DUF3800 domain-containing protein [Acinetobacter calcoaceticus/baumannii complex]EXB08840.1 hypothetical protein J513_3356 [Acinetobacter baumannii 1397084]EYD11454.1 hypothetical protein J935_1799 [Acinetobacter baumannii 44362_2]KCW35494.1 hypothetical protein J471_3535 [Acinetobacter baumannii 1032359]AXQ89349.1 hypothetical protein BSF95_00954 [Acinetobacter baumannii WM99c]AZK38628.1 DUF3800 domain-containing protein [Acinetobacter baumannii]